MVIQAPKAEEAMTVLVFGPEGVGKSYVLAAIHNEWVEEGRLANWIDCNEWPEDERESEAAFHRALNQRILILDDLGREPAKARVTICRLIMSYINQSIGVLLISTNFKVVKEEIALCELAANYGRAERSRMLEGVTLRFDGKDMRLA